MPESIVRLYSNIVCYYVIFTQNAFTKTTKLIDHFIIIIAAHLYTIIVLSYQEHTEIARYIIYKQFY